MSVEKYLEIFRNRDIVPVFVLLRLFRPFFVNKTPKFELFLNFFVRR
jgi:hypothetical protein